VTVVAEGAQVLSILR